MRDLWVGGWVGLGEGRQACAHDALIGVFEQAHVSQPFMMWINIMRHSTVDGVTLRYTNACVCV